MNSVADKINSLLERGDSVVSTERLTKLGVSVAQHLQNSLTPRTHDRGRVRLYASELGERCLRKLWFKQHQPDTGDPLPGHTKFKFLYGNVVEELALTLAEEAGCKVTHQQERVDYVGPTGTEVSGRIDAMIDGAVVDVKSSSSQGMKKYNGQMTHETDTFGYSEQLWFYYYKGLRSVSSELPYFLFVDKTLGHIEAVKPVYMTEEDLDQAIFVADNAILQTNAPEIPVSHAAVPEGTSGNLKLCTSCSYCPFKDRCWDYQTYLYSGGPVYLTKVVREPKVPRLKNKVPF